MQATKRRHVGEARQHHRRAALPHLLLVAVLVRRQQRLQARQAGRRRQAREVRKQRAQLVKCVRNGAVKVARLRNQAGRGGRARHAAARRRAAGRRRPQRHNANSGWRPAGWRVHHITGGGRRGCQPRHHMRRHRPRGARQCVACRAAGGPQPKVVVHAPQRHVQVRRGRRVAAAAITTLEVRQAYEGGTQRVRLTQTH